MLKVKLQMDENKILAEHCLNPTNTVDKLLTFLKGLGQPTDIQVIAKSTEIHKTILEHSVAFTHYFSREAIKTIIYQACIFGNLELVRCLIDSIQLDVVNEKIANPLGHFKQLQKGTYEFTDLLPPIQAAAYSNSLALMQYLVSFYDLNQLDKTAVKGDLQGALVIAAGRDAYDTVNYLLSCGVNPNAVLKEAHTIPALYRSILTGSLAIVQLLVERGSKITALDQYAAVRNGRLDVVRYFVAKGVSYRDDRLDVCLMTAFESRSVEMVDYFLNTLGFKLNETNDNLSVRRNDLNLEVAKKVLHSGSVEMVEYLERKLDIPVIELIQAERDTTQSFHHGQGRTMLFEAVSSYQVTLLKYLFETRGLLPNPNQLNQLASYAFDSSVLEIRHQKFLSHLYLTSFIQGDKNLRQLFRDVAEIGNLKFLTNEELFILYAHYTKDFSEVPVRLECGNKFCDHVAHLTDEISRRNLSSEALFKLGQQDNFKLVPAIRFYLTVTGTDYSGSLKEMMQQRCIVDSQVKSSINHFASKMTLGLDGHPRKAFEVGGRARLGFFDSPRAYDVSAVASIAEDNSLNKQTSLNN